MTGRPGLHWDALVAGLRVVVRTAEDGSGHPIDVHISIDRPAAWLNTRLEEIALGISLGLRRGVPMDVYTHGLRFQTFWPNGEVQGDPLVEKCSSVVDYVAQALDARYPGGRRQLDVAGMP